MIELLRFLELTNILEFMDRKLFLQVQGGRQVSGVLRGYDVFLNLVMDNAYEELGGGVRKPCGMVVSSKLASSHYRF